MSSEYSNKVSVREGLVRVVSAERFQAKPRPSGNVHVVVMQKTGDTLRHYTTLRSPADDLSLGEKFWGNFICLVVDMSLKNLRMEWDFPTRDHITNVHVSATISYQVVDAERAVVLVDDVLHQLKETLTTMLKREVARLALAQVKEEYLEDWLYRESSFTQNMFGIQIRKVDLNVEWDKEVVGMLREDRERRVKEEREQKARERERRLDLEEITHIDEVVRRLGLEALPPDFKLRLHALPRKDALLEVVDRIEKHRARILDDRKELFKERMTKELGILQQMIDKGILEQQDGLVDFGKELMDRYRHMSVQEDLPELPLDVLFGSGIRPTLGEGKRPKSLPSRKGRSSKKEDDIDDTEEEE